MKNESIALYLIVLFSLLSYSCTTNTNVKESGILEGSITGSEDSVILVNLHPDVILDTIKIINGKFSYKFPTINYKRVRMTPSSTTFQNGWCKNKKYRCVKLILIEKSGAEKPILFQVPQFNRPFAFDAIILDNNKINLTINKNDLEHTKVDGSKATNILFESVYNRSDQDRYYKLTSKKIVDLNIIKEFSSNKFLIRKIYADREVYTKDTLSMIYKLFNKNIRTSEYGKRLSQYIKDKK